MDHIFGDSHDITFGIKNSPQPSRVPASTQGSPRKVQHDDFGDLDGSRAPSRIHLSTPSSPTSPVPPVDPPHAPKHQKKPTFADRKGHPSLPVVESDTVPALARLIGGMKSSFLPREEDLSAMRIVALSSHSSAHPLFLIHHDNTTVLVGSGFDSIMQSGIEYTTFPDMRLPASEKASMSAWILLDPLVDIHPFQTILPAIGFPPIYATRDIIAKFRDNITDLDFLGKCRFFELFADDMTERRIGDIEIHSGTSLIVSSGTARFAFSHYPLSGVGTATEIVIGQDGYSIGGEAFSTGEIMTLRSSKIEKHSMKFTFDTFFIDKNSVGVVAGYTLSDRQQLGESGVLIFTFEEDHRARTIAGHIFIDSRGFVHAHEMMSVHKEILKGIRATYEKIITENPHIDRGSLVQGLRREMTKYCYLLTGRTPVVMPILIER